MMFRTLTLSAFTLALLGTAPSASAYFVEDLLPSLPDLSDESNAQETPLVSPVILPSDETVITRALFTAMVVEERHAPGIISECYWDIASSVPPHFTKVFADVSTDHPYAKHLCIAVRDGLILGFGDGTFRPDQPITAAETSRILARAYALTPYADATHYDLWFEPYVWALASRNAIPREVESLGQPVTVAIAQDMHIRVRDDLRMLPSKTYRELVAPPAPRVSVRNAPAPAAQEEPVTEEDVSTDETVQPDTEEEVDAPPADKKSFWDLF